MYVCPWSLEISLGVIYHIYCYYYFDSFKWFIVSITVITVSVWIVLEKKIKKRGNRSLESTHWLLSGWALEEPSVCNRIHKRLQWTVHGLWVNRFLRILKKSKYGLAISHKVELIIFVVPNINHMYIFVYIQYHRSRGLRDASCWLASIWGRCWLVVRLKLSNNDQSGNSHKHKPNSTSSLCPLLYDGIYCIVSLKVVFYVILNFAY